MKERIYEWSVRMKSYTEEEMLDYLDFKGYEVTDQLDLMAKAEAIGFKFVEFSKRWVMTKANNKY